LFRYFFLYPIVTDYRKSKFGGPIFDLPILFKVQYFDPFFLYPISIEYRKIDKSTGSAQLCCLVPVFKNISQHRIENYGKNCLALFIRFPICSREIRSFFCFCQNRNIR
jgi:hypothetical protein